MTTFKPYADDETVLTIGELSIENGKDSVAVHGSLDLRRNPDGLKQARALLKAIEGIVEMLETDPLDAPANESDGDGSIANPFG